MEQLVQKGLSNQIKSHNFAILIHPKNQEKMGNYVKNRMKPLFTVKIAEEAATAERQVILDNALKLKLIEQCRGFFNQLNVLYLSGANAQIDCAVPEELEQNLIGFYEGLKNQLQPENFKKFLEAHQSLYPIANYTRRLVEFIALKYNPTLGLTADVGAKAVQALLPTAEAYLDHQITAYKKRQDFLHKAKAAFLREGRCGHLPAAFFVGTKNLLWGYLGKKEADIKLEAMIEAQQLYR